MNHSFPVAIFPGDYPDPSVLRVGNDFYLTHSSFNYAPGLQIWHSRDLFSWSPLGAALPQYDSDVWAPELVRHDDKYLIYYKTSGGNHVVWADEIDGVWSAPIDLNVGYIDPGHVVAPDGTRYLHLCNGHAIELAPDGLSTRGELRKVYEGWPIPQDWRVEGVCLEGPKLLWRDGWCYLLSAQGGTAGPATSHMVVCARSRHPLGPWQNCPHNPIVHTRNREERWWSQGHGTLVDDLSGQWWMTFHAYEKGFHTLGRQTLLAPVHWTPDGWPLLDFEHSKSSPEPHLAQNLSDEFDMPRLSSQWRFWGEHDPSRYSIENGALTLRAQGEAPAQSAPLCCIPIHHAYQVEVEVEVRGGEAGIVLFYNPQCCLALGVDAEGAFIHMPSGWRFRPESETSKPSLDNAVPRATLRLVNDRHEVDFWVKFADRDWFQMPTSVETSGFHHNVFGGFVSLRVGLYAAGNGEARFRHFSYRAL